MTHCRGCGGGARETHSGDFVHLLGCGWRKREEKGKKVEKREDRHTPSTEQGQRGIITGAYKAGLAAKKNGDDMAKQIDAFVDTLLDRLDEWNED